MCKAGTSQCPISQPYNLIKKKKKMVVRACMQLAGDMIGPT